MTSGLATAALLPAKLHVDFVRRPWRFAVMAKAVHTDISSAIATLLLAAATLMEDASVDAISMMPDDHDALAELTARLRDAGYEIAVLTAAAHVLILRSDGVQVADEE